MPGTCKPSTDRARAAIAWVVALSIPLMSAIAVAYPEGAPWGAADPDAAENCSTCHFDGEPVRDAPSISIEGIPGSPVAGDTYTVVIRFRDDQAATAGFQLLARSSGDSAGWFSSAEADTESQGPAIRSTRPSANRDSVRWELEWRAPDDPGATIRFFVAVTGSNDDGSPFGDRIYFRSVTVRL